MADKTKIVPDQGWSWVVLVAAFFCNVTFDGIIYSFGVLNLELLDTFGAGRGMTSWIGSVISGVYAVIGPVASVLANKFGCRAMTMTGALISSAGFVLSTFSPNITVMILTYGVMGGIGFGLMFLCAYVMIGHFFERQRALATGIASCGSGVGTFVFAALAVFLINEYTWKGAMWILAGVVLNGVVCGAVFRPLPEDPGEEAGNGEKGGKQLMDFTLLKTPAFIVLCMSSFLCMIGFFVPFIYLPSYARDMGLTARQGAFLISIIGLTNTIGRVVCGFISDKAWADPLKIYNWSLIIGGLSTMACAWLQSFPLLAVYAVIFGLCVAAYVSLTAIILVEFLGLQKLSNSFGFLNMFRGFATFIGAPLAGFLLDLTGTYDLAFYTAGAAIACAGVICLPLRMLTRCDPTAGAQLDRVHKVLAMRAEDSAHMHNGQGVKAVPDEDQLALTPPDKQDAMGSSRNIFSSVTLLAGSHLSIGLPNPYISYEKLKYPVEDNVDELDTRDGISSCTELSNFNAKKQPQLSRLLHKTYFHSDSEISVKCDRRCNSKRY